MICSKVDAKRSRERPGRQWLGDVKEWTGLSWNEMWWEALDLWRGESVSVLSPQLNKYSVAFLVQM